MSKKNIDNKELIQRLIEYCYERENQLKAIDLKIIEQLAFLANLISGA